MFHLQLLAVLALALLAGSFMESDRRGLLFDSDPFAFSLDNSAFVLDGLDAQFGSAGAPRLGFLTLGGPWGDRNVGRTAARRDIGNRQLRTRNVPSTQGGGNTQTPPSRLVSPTPTGIIGPGNSGSPSSLGAANFTPGQTVPGGNFLPSPIGNVGAPTPAPPAPTDPTDPTDPTTPVDPVVPAIPEPASWLLMIIGVGWLGMYFRKNPTSLVTAATA